MMECFYLGGALFLSVGAPENVTINLNETLIVIQEEGNVARFVWPRYDDGGNRGMPPSSRQVRRPGGSRPATLRPASNSQDDGRRPMIPSEMRLARLMRHHPGVSYLHTDALNRIKAVVDGTSEETVKDIVYGLLEEIAALREALWADLRAASSAALTPAPQPEECKHCVGTGYVEDAKTEGPPSFGFLPCPVCGTATPTAQEAVPVRWQWYDQERLGWVNVDEKGVDYYHYRGHFIRHVIAHPPQPSAPVALAPADEQLDAAATEMMHAFYNIMGVARSPTAANCRDALIVALRALKGSTE